MLSISRQFVLLVGFIALLPASALAASGKAIFVLGQASVIAADGSDRVLKKGDSVDQGEVIVTADKAHVQIRMEDGGLIAVRPASRFRIDNFVYTRDTSKDKSEFSLIKGGFRSITGAIGQANKKAYHVKTPVATIGIRGTDYTARLCSGDCQGMAANDGLYIGVFSGGVVLKNDAGSIDIAPQEYGFVGDTLSSPQYLPEAPTNLLFVQADPSDGTTQTAATSPTGNPEPANTETGQTDSGTVAVAVNAVDSSGNTVDLTGGTLASKENANTAVTNTISSIGFASAAFTSSSTNAATLAQATTAVGSGAAGEVMAFNTMLDNSSGTAREVHLDVDTTTNTLYDSGSSAGISWGRWSGGSVTVTDVASGTTTTEDLSVQSLHWIEGPEMSSPVALPSMGTATYAFAGGTSPTDNFGNAGSMTSATIGVNFTAMTLDTTMDLNVNGNQWLSNASATPLNGDGTFGGSFGTVSVGATPGQGDFSGALVGTADPVTGAPSGAFMTYTLDGTVNDPTTGNIASTSVSGANAFTLAP